MAQCNTNQQLGNDLKDLDPKQFPAGNVFDPVDGKDPFATEEAYNYVVAERGKDPQTGSRITFMGFMPMSWLRLIARAQGRPIDRTQMEALVGFDSLPEAVCVLTGATFQPIRWIAPWNIQTWFDGILVKNDLLEAIYEAGGVIEGLNKLSDGAPERLDAGCFIPKRDEAGEKLDLFEDTSFGATCGVPYFVTREPRQGQPAGTVILGNKTSLGQALAATEESAGKNKSLINWGMSWRQICSLRKEIETEIKRKEQRAAERARAEAARKQQISDNLSKAAEMFRGKGKK